MKKLTPFVMVAAFGMMMFASCKKDYSCTCVTKIDGTVVSTTDVALGKQKKKDAESACSGKNTEVSMGGMTTSMSCTLK